MQNRKGIAFSFFGNDKVNFSHKISESEPLQNISIFSTIKNLQKLSIQEHELYTQNLGFLTGAKEDFEIGPSINMTPQMHAAANKIFNTSYKDAARLLFLKSQVTELLAHYFAHITAAEKPSINIDELKKIQMAKDIIIENIATPPSLKELSNLIGLNSNKLKKNFKQLFGVPVFKYIQLERLQKAHQLLAQNKLTVQEVAWDVGYESISSFSNAFLKEYGFRPSDTRK